MTALDQLRVHQIVGQYGVDVAVINCAIESGVLPARDARRDETARHAYRVLRKHAEAWIEDGCPIAA